MNIFKIPSMLRRLKELERKLEVVDTVSDRRQKNNELEFKLITKVFRDNGLFKKPEPPSEFESLTIAIGSVGGASTSLSGWGCETKANPLDIQGDVDLIIDHLGLEFKDVKEHRKLKAKPKKKK